MSFRRKSIFLHFSFQTSFHNVFVFPNSIGSLTDSLRLVSWSFLAQRSLQLNHSSSTLTFAFIVNKLPINLWLLMLIHRVGLNLLRWIGHDEYHIPLILIQFIPKHHHCCSKWTIMHSQDELRLRLPACYNILHSVTGTFNTNSSTYHQVSSRPRRRKLRLIGSFPLIKLLCPNVSHLLEGRYSIFSG